MHLTPDERAEIARLFRSKLASLGVEERKPSRRPGRRTGRTRRVPEVPTFDDALLSTGEVAALLGVTPHTIRRWDLPCIYTLGGQRRYRWADVRTNLERDKRP